MTLLENKRSMGVSIFLKHIKKDISEIIAMIKQGDMKKLGSEHLIQLQRILPEPNEVCFFILLKLLV